MSLPSLLAIETSVETGSVAFVQNGKVTLERSFLAGRRPSATLWPALEEVMREVASLSAIVVGIGPGSYNGSRVGIAAAQGIALVHGCRVVPICSFEGVLTRTRRALAIGNARRGSYSLQWLEEGRLQGDFSLVNETELAKALNKAQEEGVSILSFDRGEVFPVEEKQQQWIEHRSSQSSVLAQAFLSRNESERERLLQVNAEPFYLREPHITVGKRKSPLER